MFFWICCFFIIQISADICVPSVEIFQVQDVSQTFERFLDDMVDLVKPMLVELQVTYPDLRYGLAKFSDKGIPGYGYNEGYGGFGGRGIAWDTCYELVQPLTRDFSLISEALNSLVTSAGADFEESHLDALVNVVMDPLAGWTLGQKSENGQMLAKIGILISDSFPHMPGTAQKQIDDYNAVYGTSRDIWYWVYEFENYKKWVDFRLEESEMSTIQKIQFVVLNATYGPDLVFVPEKLIPFEYNAQSYYQDGATCEDHDYVDPKDPGFRSLFFESSVVPVVMAWPYADDEFLNSAEATQEDIDWDTAIRRQFGPLYCPNVAEGSSTFHAECTHEYWEGLLRDVGGVVQVVPSKFTAQNFVELLKTTVDQAVDMVCNPPPPIPTTTITTTTTTVPTTTTTVPTTAKTPATTTTNNPNVSPPLGQTTSTSVEGTSGGLIIGAATIGALAAGAAVAGLLYFQGGASPAIVSTAQNLDAMESPMNREVMEEVTMDMFS